MEKENEELPDNLIHFTPTDAHNCREVEYDFEKNLVIMRCGKSISTKDFHYHTRPLLKISKGETTMKKYIPCTAGEALDASKTGKKIEVSWGTKVNWENLLSFLSSRDWDDLTAEFRIVEEVPDPEPPKLPKWAGWMHLDTGTLVNKSIIEFYTEAQIEKMAASGEIVPPSVWMKQ